MNIANYINDVLIKLLDMMDILRDGIELNSKKINMLLIQGEQKTNIYQSNSQNKQSKQSTIKTTTFVPKIDISGMSINSKENSKIVKNNSINDEPFDNLNGV